MWMALNPIRRRVIGFGETDVPGTPSRTRPFTSLAVLVLTTPTLRALTSRRSPSYIVFPAFSMLDVPYSSFVR